MSPQNFFENGLSGVRLPVVGSLVDFVFEGVSVGERDIGIGIVGVGHDKLSNDVEFHELYQRHLDIPCIDARGNAVGGTEQHADDEVGFQLVVGTIPREIDLKIVSYRRARTLLIVRGVISSLLEINRSGFVSIHELLMGGWCFDNNGCHSTR